MMRYLLFILPTFPAMTIMGAVLYMTGNCSRGSVASAEARRRENALKWRLKVCQKTLAQG